MEANTETEFTIETNDRTFYFTVSEGFGPKGTGHFWESYSNETRKSLMDDAGPFECAEEAYQDAIRFAQSQAA